MKKLKQYPRITGSDVIKECAIEKWESSLTYAFSVWTVKRVYFPETYDGSFKLSPA